MAEKSTHVVKFRRRRENRTNYKKRLQYLKSGKSRFVVRTSNKHCLCQVVRYSSSGDVTIAIAHSVELVKYGYKGNTGNRKAAYLTGYLCARRSGEKRMILDIGLQHPHPRGRLYSALKGAVDVGVEVSHEKNILPDDGVFADLAQIKDKIDKAPGKKTKKESKPKKTKPKKKGEKK